jgi:fructokinase
MPRDDVITELGRTRPAVVGTGLVALDVVITEDAAEAPRSFVGGTCGNVLTVLSYLGWKAAPVSRLGPGVASERVLEDLREWNVSTEFVSLKDDGSTPVIIERIGRTTSGEPYHTFSWRCPACGAHLPGYKPVLASVAQELSERLPDAQVYFFDRVSRGALLLAEACADRGALVVFEPSGVGDPDLFREAWCLAHVIKYSHERLRDIADLDLGRSERDGVLLEIETLGAGGLRYRSRLPACKSRGWQTLDAFPVDLRDAAGSGDCCTAGLLDKLARSGLAGLKKTSPEKLREGIRYGQALAAWNCGFTGARGGMYEVDESTFREQVARILAGSDTKPLAKAKQGVAADHLVGRLCPACKEADSVPSMQPRNGTQG